MIAKTTLRILSTLLLAVTGIAGNAQSNSPVAPARNKAVSPKVVANYGKLPLSFEPNQGQTSTQAQWLARGPEYTLFLAGDDAVLEINKIAPGTKTSGKPADLEPTIHSSALRMNLLGAQTAEQERGEEPLPGKANYFTGNDSSKWQRDVPMFGKVRMDKVYPGIDLVYYGQNSSLEYDFVVAPGADASAIKLRFDGAKPNLAKNGDLLLPVDGGTEVRFNKPVVYQMKDGVRQSVDGSFTIAENQQVSFTLGAYDKSRELIIDPTLVFNGTLGTGSAQTQANGMTVDASGEIILTGVTQDLTFPVTAGALQPICTNLSAIAAANGYTRCGAGGTSGFVTKISADGTSLVYSTYLHGLSGAEYGQAVAVDTTGVTYILGMTSSNDFPITSNAYQTLCMPRYPGSDLANFGPIEATCDGFNAGGGTEYTVGGPTMFLVKLSADGSQIIYGTFFGGTIGVYPVSLALDSSNNMYFTGYLQSAEPANNAYPNSGVVQFPVTAGAYQTAGLGEQSATLSKLSADGQTLMYSTLMGPPSAPSVFAEPSALAVGQNGITFLGGTTYSANFPTTPGVIQPTCAGGSNGYCPSYYAFVSAFDTTQQGENSLVYSTFLNGTTPANSSNLVNGLVADSSNNLYVTGYTDQHDFPTTTGVYQSACNYPPNGYCNTAFVTKLNPTGTEILWSTFLGGTSANPPSSTGNALALDASGQVYVYGSSQGGDFPQVNGVQPYYGGNETFISVLSPNATQLLFSTWFSNPAASSYPSPSGGLALDATGNIYFSGYSADNGNFVTTPGTYATTATGGYNRTFFAKISPVMIPSATALTITPSPASTGQSVSFTAIVTSPVQTTPIPTGTVVFTDTLTTPATELGTTTLNATGTATFNTANLSAGTYNVTATYSGDSEYDLSTSTAQPLVISTPTLTATNTTLTASAATVASGASITFTSTTTGTSGTPAPTGAVSFLDGTTTLGTGNLNGSGVATLSTTSLAVGAYSITASYAGDSNNAASVSAAVAVTVTATAPNFTLSLSSNSLTVASAATATTTISVTPVSSFASATTFACTGLPANSTCSFSPTSVTPNGAAATTTLTVTTGAASTTASLIQHTRPGILTRLLVAGSGSVLAMLFWPGLANRKRRAAWLRMMGIALLAIVTLPSLTGCGGSGTKTTTSTGTTGTSTPAGTSTVTVTATSGSLTHTTTFTLTVQ